jgi:hypothetical protein
MSRCTSEILRVYCLIPIVWVLVYGNASGRMISTERAMNPHPRKKEIPVFTLANLAPPYIEHAYFEGHDLLPFQADAVSFNLANAWWLAEASTLAYAEEEFATDWFKKAGFDEVRFFDQRSTQCFVASNREFAVVAFRGSEVWRRRGKTDLRVIAADLMTNADFRLTDWPNGGKVHRGFKHALDEVWEDLLACLTALQRGERRIWMTGHSLGAALATLAADRFGEVQGVYTFGSPRVGNLQFKESYSNRVYRLVNGSDIVAQMPSEGFYVHVGEPRFIYREGTIRFRPIEYVSPFSSDRVNGEGAYSSEKSDSRKASFFVPDSFLDHVPLLYALLIWNQLVDVE